MNEQKLSNNNKGTWTAKDRQERVDAIRELVKKKKKVVRTDVYRFMLQRFGISIRAIDDYITALSYEGCIEIKDAPVQFPLDPKKSLEKQTLVWRGGEGK